MSGEKDVNADKRVAVYIAILAVLLTVCTMGGDNSTKDATRANIDASDTWAHYQAKKLREVEHRLAADALEMKLAAEPGMPEGARKQIEDKIRKYREEAERFKSDPKEHDGQAELSAKAKAYVAERDEAMRRDPYFDYATAFLQIAIVLSSASILFGGGVLLALSAVVGGAGVILMVNGFTLLFNLPFLG